MSAMGQQGDSRPRGNTYTVTDVSFGRLEIATCKMLILLVTPTGLEPVFLP